MAEQFYALITDIGLAKITNGLINNTKVDFTHMAIGDGGGSYYNPSTSQTGLVREMWRGPVGMVAIDEKDSNRVQIVSPIPPNAGGFFIREVGLFDAECDLIVIAKHPETYKPVADNGSTKELTVKLLIDVANASSIVMKLDPTVITATREYVDNKVSPISTKLIQLEEDFTTHLDKIKKRYRVGKTSNQPIPNGVITDVIYNDLVAENGADFLSLNNGIITITQSGEYQIEAQVRFGFDTRGSRQLYVLGSADFVSIPSCPDGATAVRVVKSSEIQAGTILQVKVFQSSGGALDLLAIDTRLSVRKLG